jgi:hypothetical protein
MASSSSIPESSSSMKPEIPESTSHNEPAYEIRGRTMSLEEWELKIQTENPVDFNSVAYHGCDSRSYYEEQGMMTVALLGTWTRGFIFVNFNY